MATDYANNAIFGSQWQNAKLRGDTSLMNNLQARMDAMSPQDISNFNQQVGMIQAKTMDMGRGDPNAYSAIQSNGLEYNTLGQSRTPGQGSYNSITGAHGFAVNPGAWQGAAIGTATDPTKTMTAADYAAKVGNPAPTSNGPYIPYGGTTPVQGTPIDQYVKQQTSQSPITGPGQNGLIYSWNTPGAGTTPSAGTSTSTSTSGGVTPTTTSLPVGTSAEMTTHVGNPPQWVVSPNQLVENRIKGILGDNNPLMQQAKTQGLISAQERGLLNTSMGVEAGQKALYDYAVPIATVDSQTLSNAAKTNVDAAVTTAGQQSSLTGTLAGVNASMVNAALSSQTQKDIAAAQMNFNSLQNVSEGVRYGWGTLQSGINQVLSSNMTPAAKDAAVRDMTSQYLAYANTVSSIYQIDLSPLLSQWMPRTA